MTKLEAALLDVAAFLEEQRVPYMVIGGVANLHWGAERFTRDIDIAIEIADDALDGLIRSLEARFTLAVSDPLAFARRNHLIRLLTRTGVDVDLILAVIPYELAAIRRAVSLEISGKAVKICTAEDLIVHKLASERPQDAVDVEGVVLRQAGRLDLDSLWPRVRELAAGLERPAIIDLLSTSLAKAGARGEPEAGDG